MCKPTFHDGIIDFRDEPEIKMGKDLKRLGFELEKIYDYDTQLKKVTEHFDIAQGGTRTIFSVWTKKIFIPSGVSVHWDRHTVDLTAEVSFDGYIWECTIRDPLHKTRIYLQENQLKEAQSIEIFGTKGYSGLREFKKA